MTDYIPRLEEYQKKGWSWSVGYSSQWGYEARAWKNKAGVQRLNWTARHGRHVILVGGNSLSQAAEELLSRLDAGQFDQDPPQHSPFSIAQGKSKESYPDGSGQADKTLP